MTDKKLHTETYKLNHGDDCLIIEYHFFDNGDHDSNAVYDNIFMKFESNSASINIDLYHAPNWPQTLIDISNKVRDACKQGNGTVRAEISDKTELIYTVENHQIADNKIVLHNYFNIATLSLKGQLMLTPSILTEMAHAYSAGRKQAQSLKSLTI